MPSREQLVWNDLLPASQEEIACQGRDISCKNWAALEYTRLLANWPTYPASSPSWAALMNVFLRTLLSLAIVGGGIGGFFWMGTNQVPPQVPADVEPELVTTAVAIEHLDGIQFEVDGVVVPFRQLQIAAQVGGRVEYKSEKCRIGRAVNKGDLLLRIEQQDYDIEVKRLSEELEQDDAMLQELAAEINSANNQIKTAEEQLRIETRQLERSNDLVARRVTSDAEVEDARRMELSSRNALQTLIDQKNLLETRRIRLESAKALGQADLEKANLALARTEIRSPIDGIVFLDNVEQDGYVQPGTTVVSLQDTSQLDVTCKLYMRQMNWLWQSKPAKSSSDARGMVGSGDSVRAYDFPETPAKVIYSMGDAAYQWEGVVNRFDGAGIDSQTRMVPCLVNVSNPLEVSTLAQGEQAYDAAVPPTLMTGMFVKVRIDARPPIPLVRLPASAIQPGNRVWTVLDGKLRSKPVAIANSDTDTIIAYQQVDGLQAGDTLVVSPLATPMENAPVRDVDKDPPPKKPSGGGWGGAPGGKPNGKSAAQAATNGKAVGNGS